MLTEHRYSARRRYQIIVPLGHADEFLPAEGDLVVTGIVGLDNFSSGRERVVFAISEIHSVFHPQEIESWTGTVVDEATLAEIEARLKTLFEL